MSVGKGFTRPGHWPAVGSIVQVTEDIRLGREVAAFEGDWVVVHLTQGSIREADGTRYSIRISMLFAATDQRPLFRVFRNGRRDYSQAWHATPAWMEMAK